MRRLPVGKLGAQADGDLGALVLHRAILAELRPFLERWQADFRHWWDQESDRMLPPVARQERYPHHQTLLADWTRLRLALRSLQGQLVQAYGFVNLDADCGTPAAV